MLIPDYLTAAAAEWAGRLGISPPEFLAAVFGGSDEQVLVGRMPEQQWWSVVAGRLPADARLIRAIRADLAAREVWDADLVGYLREVRGRAPTAIVANAWPGLRARMRRAGLAGLTDRLVLSAEVGWAKPDPRIYQVALRRLHAAAGDALFVDDTASHVAAARALGLAGHVHEATATTIARIEAHLSARSPASPARASPGTGGMPTPRSRSH